jgi:hypothetical protein
MLTRPVRFFFTEPIVCTVSIMSATVFGSVYLQTEGIKVIYESFGFGKRQAALPLTCWIVGLMFTIPLRIYDWRIVSRRLRQGLFVRPEDKITGFYVAAPVLAISLWWLSWTVPPYVSDSRALRVDPGTFLQAFKLTPKKAQHISSLVSIAALTLVGACTNEFDGILQGYLTDSYTSYAASANAPLAFLRGILSAVFPMFGEQMFVGLGSNVSGSILAAIATAFCGIAVWFWFYGTEARERSEFAVSETGAEDEWGLA